jgi:hypothetical protein
MRAVLLCFVWARFFAPVVRVPDANHAGTKVMLPKAPPRYARTVASLGYAPQYAPQNVEPKGWSLSSLLLVLGIGAGLAYRQPVAILTVSVGENAETDVVGTVALGAACVGGLAGLYYFHTPFAAAGLGLLVAYGAGATVDNVFGTAARAVGSTAEAVQSEAKELKDKYASYMCM